MNKTSLQCICLPLPSRRQINKSINKASHNSAIVYLLARDNVPLVALVAKLDSVLLQIQVSDNGKLGLHSLSQLFVVYNEQLHKVPFPFKKISIPAFGGFSQKIGGQKTVKLS